MVSFMSTGPAQHLALADRVTPGLYAGAVLNPGSYLVQHEEVASGSLKP